jgi:hypothetical protein
MYLDRVKVTSSFFIQWNEIIKICSSA